MHRLAAKLFYGLTPTELRKIAFDFAEKNQIKHRFNHIKEMAGKDWLQCFLKWKPQLSIRKPESVSVARIAGFSVDAVKLFYNNLEQVLNEYKFSVGRTYT